MSGRYRFGPAAPTEAHVYGSTAPGFGAADPAITIDDYVEYVSERGIERVCCLLEDSQLAPYGDLIGQYRAAFGHDRVLHAPIPDHHLASTELLNDTILPSLADAADADEPIVVHCLAGLGRTGHVHAAWLVYEHDYDPVDAFETVSTQGRMPDEAIRSGNATGDELATLLASVEPRRSET